MHYLPAKFLNNRAQKPLNFFGQHPNHSRKAYALGDQKSRKARLTTGALLGFSLVLGLGGCDKNKIPLEGVRESVILHENIVQPNPTLSGLTVTIPAPVLNRDWPQAGGHASHVMPPLLLGSPLTEVWKKPIGEGGGAEQRLLSGPVTDGKALYAMDTQGVVSAINTETGDIIWSMSIVPEYAEPALLGGGVAYSDDHLFIASPLSEVLCLNAKTGEILWRKAVNGPARAAPTVRDQRVFIVTINNELEALDAKTGQLLWSHMGIAESAGLLGGASPAVGEGVVIVPYSSGEVYALRAENGHQLWAESLVAGRRLDSVSTLSQIKERPIIDRGRVFVIGHGGRMSCIDLRTGKKIWECELSGTRSPAIAGDFIFLITTQQELVCLQRETGKIKWVKKLPQGETKTWWAGPIFAGDSLVVCGTDSQALFLSIKDGSQQMAYTLPAPTLLSPIIAEKTLYFLSEDGVLSAWR